MYPPALLRAFRSPLVMASIVVLLVNDHLLKAAAPSWVTGKLSDFAGLFFFPFVAGVGYPARRAGRTSTACFSVRRPKRRGR
jgi:hypothetical protein